MSLSLPFGRLALVAVLTLTGIGSTTAHATSINVVNGDFEQLATNRSSEFGARYPAQQVAGWTAQGYNFVFLPGTADNGGAIGEYGNLQLWGPGNGAMNGLTSTSPAGGNFVGMDGAYAQGPISQTLTGLDVNGVTTVSFWFAGAQQYGYTGITTEQFAVSLGDQTVKTEVLTDADHGFTGWQKETLTFQPTSSTEVLSFLAIGTPAGEPPFSLLDGVAVDSSPVPEPSSLALMLTGIAGVGGYARSRFLKK